MLGDAPVRIIDGISLVTKGDDFELAVRAGNEVVASVSSRNLPLCDKCRRALLEHVNQFFNDPNAVQEKPK